MNRIVIGLDIAKRVFQLLWVEPQTGEIVALQIKREKFLRQVMLFAIQRPDAHLIRQR
jgi:hypothetical protein